MFSAQQNFESGTRYDVRQLTRGVQRRVLVADHDELR
jgi:hypothetical protein